MQNPTLMRALRKAIYNRPLESSEQLILEQWQIDSRPGKIFEDEASVEELLRRKVQAVHSIKDLQDLFGKLFTVGKYPVSKLGDRIQYSVVPFDEDYDPATLETSTGKVPAHYEIRELDDLIPSHDPLQQFAKREEYPEGVQERPYHSDKGEQEKVRRNAANLNPRYLLNTNPDAMTGPPVISTDGVVLGGNSRTMSMQLAYESFPKKAQEYREYLAKLAPVFGFTPAQVKSMKKPTLVRVTNQGMDKQEMAQASRRFNETTTQSLKSEAEGVSKSKLITSKSLSILGNDLQEFDSLRGYLASPKSKELLDSLLSDGVIEQVQLSRITNEDGLLNNEGKELIENTLRGLIIPDYDVIRKTPASLLDKIDRAIPSLAQLRNKGGDWDLSALVTTALKQISVATNGGFDLKTMAGYFGQVAMFPDPDREHKGVQAVALTLTYASGKEVATRLAAFAADSAKKVTGMAALVPGSQPTPEQAFVNAFLRPMASVGNKPIANFRPDTKPSHASIEWAYNASRQHTVEAAMAALEDILIDSNKTPDEKEEAREHIRHLASYDGLIVLYRPKLGDFYSYRPGEDNLLEKPESWKEEEGQESGTEEN